MIICVSHTGWLASFGAYNQFDKETGYFIYRKVRIMELYVDERCDFRKQYNSRFTIAKIWIRLLL